MKGLKGKVTYIWNQIKRFFKIIIILLLLLLIIMLVFRLWHSKTICYITGQVIIVCAINFYLFYRKFNKNRNIDLSFVRISFFASTLCGLVYGFYLGLFTFEYVEKLYILNYLLPKKFYYFAVLAIYAIINITLSVIISLLTLKLINFFTDSSLHAGFNFRKPNAEKSLNRFTAFFIVIDSINIIIIAHSVSKIDIINKKYNTNFSNFNILDLNSTIWLIMGEVLLYLSVAMLYVHSLTKSHKISRNYSEAIAVFFKNFLVMIVTLVGLYSIVRPQQTPNDNIKNDEIKLYVTALATSLYPILDSWKYIHDEIKSGEEKNRLNKMIVLMKHVLRKKDDLH